MAAATRSVSLTQKLVNAFKNWYVYAAGYRQLGLKAEDLYMEEDPDVTSAIERLPDEEQNLRIFRIKRALDLSLKHAILPKEEWTKPEEDVAYLTPFIELVQKERKEKEKWDRL